MSKTTYAGIDYSGPGATCNRNTETGIRYGIIPANAIGQIWHDESEPDYGEPHCPKCGNGASVRRDGFDYGAECGVHACGECQKPWYPMELSDGKCPECDSDAPKVEFSQHRKHGCDDHVCHSCGIFFDSSEAYPDEPVAIVYDGDECKAFEDGSGDVWVTESPYYTYAQFCSPCAPGACHLGNPLDRAEESNKCYCLGHDWFDGGKAPYDVFSVKTNEIVQPK